MTETLNFVLSERTNNIVNLMLEIVDMAKKSGKKLIIGSGLGLDIEASSLLGSNSLTRDHGDLDIHPLEEDISFWKNWFIEKGFTIEGNDEIKDNTKAFVAFPPTFNSEKWESDPGSYYIDVYGIMIDQEGIIHSRESGKDDSWESAWDDNFIDCTWKERKITVLQHEKVLRNKRETAKEQKTQLREKDIHDHKLFGIDPNTR